MNVEALFLFLILLLGLVLCSFLGGNCNYSEGFSKNNNSDVNNDSSSNLLNSKIKQNNNSSNLNNFNDRDNSNNSSNSNNFNNRDNSNNSSNSNSNYDNYNHYSGSSSSSQLTNGSTFTSPDGGTITVNVSSDGTQSLQVTPPNGGKPSTFTIKESMTSYSGKNGSAVKFYGPNGQTAVVIKTNDGQQAIKITDSNNNSIVYTSSGAVAVHSDNTNTTYFGSTGSNLPSASYNTAYNPPTTSYNPPGTAGPNNAPGSSYNPPGTAGPNNPPGSSYNPPGTAGPNNPPGSSYNPPGTAGPNNAPGSSYNPPGTAGPNNPPGSSYDYSDSLPRGIPKSQIIPGQEDLYILKSQVIPPVCPVCPAAANSIFSSLSNDNSSGNTDKCPACPACARCPEPAFDCKKVPNYNAVNNSYLPIPVLNDFSTFGM